MTVKELKTILESSPDDMEVMMKIHDLDREFDCVIDYDYRIAKGQIEEKDFYICSDEEDFGIVTKQVLKLESFHPQEEDL